MPPPKPICTSDDYWSLPEGVRAELIDGELWGLASHGRKHQEIVSALTVRLSNFIESQQGRCKVYPAPFAVNLFADDTTMWSLTSRLPATGVPSSALPGFAVNVGRIVEGM